MRLLIVSNNPKRASFRQRIGVYIEMLEAAGIDCEAAKLPAGSFARRRLFKRAADFDGVFLHKKGLNPWDAFWLRRYARRIIYDFDDAIMFRAERPERFSGAHYNSFRRSTGLADMVIAGNQYLAHHARPFNANVRVLATGLSTAEYEVAAAKADDAMVRLVWIGSRATLGYLRMLTPAIEMVRQKYKNVVLRIIADAFLDMEHTPVEKCQWSLERQAELLITSDIGLAPLPDDSFTRGKCGFKILQYGTAGVPVVASPVGTNADYVLDGVTGFLATSLSEWVDRLGRLVSDPALRRRIGEQARLQVQKFDTGIIGKQLIQLLRQCLASSGQ